MRPIAAWLDSLALAQYTQAFVDNDIDFGVLPSLEEQDLKELGVSSMGHRKKLLQAIAALAAASAPGTQSNTERQASASLAVPPSANSRGAIAEGGERRQLTVLFCDMVGFTGLASTLDPEVLQKIVRCYEESCAACITRFDGHVFQRLGDGIVAFFGYPLAHEGEAERAVRAALAIIDMFATLDVPAVGRIAVRIGIASGVVVVLPEGEGAVGETMNLASRLQVIAPVGGVVVSERVRRLAAGHFVYRSLGEQGLKGIRKATTPYEVVRESGIASRFEAASEVGLSPIVGREEEIGVLHDRWREARRGKGQVVLLSGEPGIGKSRVLTALQESLTDEGLQAMRLQCVPYRTTTAFHPTIDNFERTLGFTRGEPAESKLDKLEAWMTQRVGQRREDVALIAALLSIPCEARYGRTVMSPQRVKRETLRCLADLCEGAARAAPTVMLFEDAHWADATSIEGLDLLVERVRDFPMLIVITHRPEFQSNWGHLDNVVQLHMSRLTNTESVAIVNRLTGGKPLPENVLDEILTRTDGVPLYVEELTRSILESGELRELDDRFVATGADHAVNIPASLRDSLMARLDRVVAVKEIAQMGAVIGRSFSWDLIRAVAAKTPTELDAALTQLTDSGLATRRGKPPHATYAFKHSLVQDVAYDSLLKSRRQHLHSSIARILERSYREYQDTEPELLAYHFGAAGLAQTAIGYGLEAARRAASRSAYTEALAILDAGDALVPGITAGRERLQMQLQLQLERAQALLVTRAYSAPETGAAWAAARELCDQLGEGVKETGLALFGFALFQLTCGDMRGAEATAREMLRQVPSSDDPSLVLMAHRTLGSLHFYRGALQEASASLTEALHAYDTIRIRQRSAPIGADQKASGLAHQSLVLHLLGYPDQALAANHDAIEHAQSLGHELGIAAMTWFVVHLAVHRRESQRALEQADRATALSEQHGFPLWSQIANFGSGVALIQLGRVSQGCDQIHEWLAWSRAMGYRAIRGFSLVSAAQGESALQHWHAAASLYVDAERELEHTGERWFEAELYRSKGEYVLARYGAAGREESHALFKQALQVARHQGARMWELRACLSIARQWHAQGRHADAINILLPVFQPFTEGHELQDLCEARALLDQLAVTINPATTRN